MGFGRNDIRACAMCGQGVGIAGPVFYRAKIEQLVLDTRAIQSEVGIEMMMGGNVPIARALSPETDFAQTVREAEVLLCGGCGCLPTVAAFLIERGEEQAKGGN